MPILRNMFTTPQAKLFLRDQKYTAEDIANLVEFLCSEKARFITGQTYICDGGRSLAMKGTD